MATEIGIVKTLIGSAVATAADGSQRNLQAGDRIYADEVITTGAAGAIEIEFSDGSIMDLGRSSQALLDNDVFDPQQTAESETEVEIAALQQALLEGEDPSQVSDPTAAGAESEGNEGTTAVVVEHVAPIIEVTSGFDTNSLPGNGLDGDDTFGEFGVAGSRSEVLAVNTDPTTTGITVQNNNDSDAINFDVSGSFNDADGNTLAFSAAGLPSGLSINSAGVISGNLNSSASQTGPYNIVITAADGNGGTVSSSFVWNVANPAPDAIDDVATLDEDTVYNGNVAGNDADPDGDTVSYSLDTDVSNGVLVFNNDGSYTYTPTANYNGSDTFTYIITDADGATDTATVSLTIVDVNDPTITAPDTGNTDEDTTLTVNAANGVLSNDSDADDVLEVASFTVAGDLTVYAAGNTANIAGVGTLTINLDGSYQFVPAADYDGAVPVATYTTNTGASDTLSISIAGINDVPTITTDTGNPANANDVVLESGLASGSNPLLADRTAQGSFTIADADGLSDITSLAVGGTTFVIGTGVGEFADFAAMVGQTVSTPSGEVTLSGYNNGTFTYSYELTSATTDIAAVIETDSFNITVSDGSSSASATVTIEITDDVPTITENVGMSITHDETIGIDADADDAALPPPSFIAGPTSNPSGVAEVNLSSLMTFNAGADGLQSISFTNAAGSALNHVDSGLTDLAGEVIYLHSQPDGSIVGMVDPDPSVIYIEGPPVVFTLVVDSSGAEPVVRFNQFSPIQHPDDLNADETVSITDLIYISIADGDGDIATTTNALTVSIQDDAPTLVADTNAADAVKEDVDTSSQGNVLTNDDVGFDGSVVSSVQFGATTEAIVSGGFAVIDGTFGSLLSNSSGVYSYTLNGAQNNVQSLAEGEVVTEEFTYTVQDGDGDTASSTLTITITGTNDAPVIDSVVSDLSGFTFNGLNVEYYGVNSQLTNIAQFRGIVDNNDPDATFRGTEISYSQGAGTVSQGENLQSFINGDAATLSADPDNASDGGLHMFGQVYLEAGTYVFRVRADDGYQITIDGNSVGEFDGNQGPTTRTHSSFTIASDGYYDVDIVWWDQGGQYVFEPELSQDGGPFNDFTPANFEFKSDATSSVIEAGTTDSGAVVDGISVASGSMTATDVDNGAVLTWSVADGAGTYGTFGIDPISGQWTYTLDNAAADPLAEGETASEQFTVIVTDEHGATDSEVVTITIQGTNDTPIAFADVAATSENASLTIDVLANDTDVDNNDNPTTFSLNSVSFAAGAASTATVSVVANQLVFNPGTDFDYLPNGATTTIIVNYTMSDDSGATSSSTVAITITGTNDGPIAQPEPDFEIFEDAAIVFGQVVATDADDAVLDYSLVGIAPAGLSFNSNGSYDFDPSHASYQDLATGETRDVTFSWKAADSSGLETVVDTVTITVKGTNDQPVIPVSSINVAADEALAGRTIFTGTLPGVTDVDASDGFSYRFVSGSFNITTSDGSTVPSFGGGLSPSGVYSINGDFNGLAEGETGTVSFQYYADDQNGFDGTDGINESSISNIVTVTLTVTGTNDAPVIQAEADFNAVEDGVIINGQVVATDIDSDDDSSTLTYTLEGTAPANAALAGLTFNSDGSYQFDPSVATYQSLAEGEVATATFSWKATDSHGADSAVDSFTITIIGTNDAPIAVADGGSTISDGDILASDDFTDLVEWQGQSDGNQLQLGSQDSASKTFDFDSENAGKTVRLDFDVSTFGSWDTSGSFQDDFIINVNGVQILLTHALGSNHYTLDVQTDANGQINLQFVVDATGSDEGVTVDNLSISAVGNNWGSIITTDEDTAITIDVLANDTDIDNGDDPSTFSLDNVSFASGVPAVPTATASIVANQLVFNPGTDFDYLAVGETATVVIDYTMSDDSGAASSSTATITVTGANDAPVITSGVQSVIFTEVTDANEAPNLTYAAVGTITYNDPDPGDTHTANFVAQAANYLGTFILDPLNDANDSVVWRFNVTNDAIDHLAAGDQLTQVYQIAIDDGQGGIAYQDVTITIDGTNDAPELSYTVSTDNVNEFLDSKLLGTLSVDDVDGTAAVLANFTVTGADAALVEIVDNAGVFELRLRSDASVDFETNPNLDVNVIYNDGIDDSNAVPVSVAVNDVDGAISHFNILQTFNGTNDEGWVGNGAANAVNQNMLGWFGRDTDERHQTFDLTQSAGDQITLSFALSTYGFGNGFGWEATDTFIMQIRDSGGNLILNVTENDIANNSFFTSAGGGNFAGGRNNFSYTLNVPTDGQITVQFYSQNTNNSLSGNNGEFWNVDNFAISNINAEVLTFDANSSGEINLQEFVAQSNDTFGATVTAPATLDEIDISNGAHVLSNITIDDVVALTDVDNTLTITTNSGTIVQLDDSQWAAGANANEYVNLASGAAPAGSVILLVDANNVLLSTTDNSYDILSGTDGADDLFATASANIMKGGDGADNFIWTKATVNTSNADEVLDFNSAEDTLDLSDLLSDGSHVIVGLENSGHLQVQVNDAGGQLVQTIDLNSVAVGSDAAAATLLNDLLTSGTIDDGI